ncbi:uncharacterized protein [Antedon mediterranea]|uniref:uncharacterized protein n=1 Tax=Antedon mediterranea TaxID=105859 RepID=UPI003AF62625
MSSDLLPNFRKHYVSDKTRLKRLKKEAQKRNCKVILHKTNIPMKNSCEKEDLKTREKNFKEKEEKDQQVPTVTDLLPTERSTSPDEYECFPCKSDDTRNIFQSIKSFSILDQSSKPSVAADTLFLTDLGKTLCDATKDGEDENFENKQNAHQVETKIKQEYTDEHSFEEENTSNWCPLTPMSESERDTVTSNASEDGSIDTNTNDNETKIPIIKQELCSDTHDCGNNNLVVNNTGSVSISSDYDSEENIIESDTEKQVIIKTEIIENNQEEYQLLKQFEKFVADNESSSLHESNELNMEISDQSDPSKLLISNNIEKSSSQPDTLTSTEHPTEEASNCEEESESNKLKISLSNTDYSRTVSPEILVEKSNNHEVSLSNISLLEDPFQESSIKDDMAEQTRNIDAKSDVLDPLYRSKNILSPIRDLEYDQDIPLSKSDHFSSIQKLVSEIVDNIVVSEETEDENVFVKPHNLQTNVFSKIENVTIPLKETPADVNSISSTHNVSINEKENNKKDRVTSRENPILTNNKTSSIPTPEEKTRTLVEPVSSNTLKSKSEEHMTLVDLSTLHKPVLKRPKRGRPKGRGQAQYIYGPYTIPGYHGMHNVNSSTNNPSQQLVNVPLRLPSKGVIGLVSQATYSEIQKHQSEHVIFPNPKQNQVLYNGQPTGPDGGIFVPIYDSKVLELVQKTISDVDKNSKMGQPVKINEQNKMIELQRPPPSYQPTRVPTISNTHTNTHAYPVQQKSRPTREQSKNIQKDTLQIGSESVLALPRNAVSNMPIPISIPKPRYFRKGSNVKPAPLTVREQLHEKMKQKLSKKSGNTTPSVSPNVCSSPSPPPPPPPPRFQVVPFATKNGTLPPTLLPQTQLTRQTSPNNHPQISQLLPPPLQAQPRLARPPQSQLPLTLAPPPLTRCPTIPSSVQVQLQHSKPLQTTTSQTFPDYRPFTTVPPMKYGDSAVTAPHYYSQSNTQHMFNHPPPVAIHSTTALHYSVNSSVSVPSGGSFTNSVPSGNLGLYTPMNLTNQMPQTQHFKGTNLFRGGNQPVTRFLKEFAIPPPYAALDLSMPTRKSEKTPSEPEPEPVPLDLSKKSVSTADINCKPLDLSQKKTNRSSEIQRSFVDEVISKQENPLSTILLQSSVKQLSTHNILDQNLSVLAAAAEMLEASNISSDATSSSPPNPKMEKLKVKFNSKRKLWHLVPGKNTLKQIGKKSKRGRPPLKKKAKEVSTGNTHSCQFCDFTDSQKSEVRLHIKSVHFSKFTKDPKTNKLHKATNSVNKEKVNTTNNNQVPLPGKQFGKDSFLCKHCDFKAKARYLLQRHVMKWHPNNTSYMCHSKDCAQMFQTIELLRQHQLMHKKNQKYVCKICGASYHYMNGLRAHDARHHASLAYPCSSCGLKFKSQGMLQRHQIQKNHFNNVANSS